MGRDAFSKEKQKEKKWFQSTRPHGARRLSIMEIPDFCKVSIHAPAWGATSEARAASGASLFQSTRPHGARQADFPLFFALDLVSIHAPAWGATDLDMEIFARSVVSIHAPAWGAT